MSRGLAYLINKRSAMQMLTKEISLFVPNTNTSEVCMMFCCQQIVLLVFANCCKIGKPCR